MASYKDPAEAFAAGVNLKQLADEAWEQEPDDGEEQARLEALPFTEDELAVRFVDKYGDELRYVAKWSRWFSLNKERTTWNEDDTLHAMDLAREVCREAAAECNNAKQAKALSAARTIYAAVQLARADRQVAATVDQWDADEWLLNTPEGAIHLKPNGGSAPAPMPEAYLTKATATVPGAEQPYLWFEFLERVTGNDLELINFLQRMVGYCLTGSTREHALFFLYGTGANGKSVFINTISALLGDYAMTAPMSTFVASKTEQHPTELAGSMGARLVCAVETQQGRRWDEPKLKMLTGGDRISARFMRADFFQFQPRFKLLIAGNHKPGLRSVDEAMRRRMHLVPFTEFIPPEERDPDLAEKLKAELPGILAWALEGCRLWQQQGLNAPAVVREATDAYLAAEDAIANWIDDDCDTSSKTFWASSKDLFAAWKFWCERSASMWGQLERSGSSSRTAAFTASRSAAPEATGG